MTDPLARTDEERYLVGLLLPLSLVALRDEALARVDPDDFGSGHLGGIWAAARRLVERRLPLNRRNLIAECHTEAGGDAVERILDKLAGYLPEPHEFGPTVHTVIATGKLRRLVETLGRATQRAYAGEDFGGAYAAVMDELAKLGEVRQDGADVVPVGQIVAELAQRYQPGGRRPAIASPWGALNELTAGGFHRGRLHVIGARPGDGKTITAHQAAAHAARHGHHGVIFSLEMSRYEVGGRLLSSDAEVDMGEIARGRLTDESWRRYHEYAGRALDLPLWVVDRPGMSPELIRSICRTHKARHGLDVVCVDYLQLLSLGGRASREQQVSEIARQFKEMSRELDCAVLLPSQLNRDTAKRGKPNMADLRESGGIEAHSDLVLLLDRQVYPEGHDAAGEPTGTISLVVAKSRFGPTGAVELPWRGQFASIG